ncbi:MAG: glycerol-3-phosphate dehydrogenase/oxidase, partial [Gemmataceae bacterium]|nr:glycerol-3-phosphate dehydrogenase/oxidase [Gemmataceae bacterium]
MRRDLDALTRETFDVLIVGGGITGAGVAFDAATRGWRVALIDQADFASGTSSVSSKLIHGGLRYLEYGQVRLVYEALRERGWLLWAAPHLVRPLRFVIPFFRGDRVPPWQWRVGLTAYDLLAGRANIRRSRPLSLTALCRELPGLRRLQLRGGAAYYDAQMDDARLCLEVLHSAQAHGAVLANYVQALSFRTAAGRVTGVVARDRLAGNDVTIAARVVLNATGPWVDQLSRRTGETAEAQLAPTKGVHVLLPDRGLTSALLLLHPRDGRVFFVIPWLGRTLVGTTDTETSQGPEALTVAPEDVAYLLEAYRYFFPNDGDVAVLGTFVGLRPLIRSRPGEPSARSREFRIFSSSDGLVSVAGGKYTTFRSMAERIT